VNLELDVEHVNGYTVLTPRGDLDLATVRDLRARIHQLLQDGNVHLVLDLEHVDFIDSSGLGVLIGARRKTFARRGSFALVCENLRVLRLLELTGLNMVFTMHGTRDEATARAVRRVR
jgi:anti-sigma B factor antagonist